MQTVYGLVIGFFVRRLLLLPMGTASREPGAMTARTSTATFWFTSMPTLRARVSMSTTEDSIGNGAGFATYGTKLARCRIALIAVRITGYQKLQNRVAAKLPSTPDHHLYVHVSHTIQHNLSTLCAQKSRGAYQGLCLDDGLSEPYTPFADPHDPEG